MFDLSNPVMGALFTTAANNLIQQFPSNISDNWDAIKLVQSLHEFNPGSDDFIDIFWLVENYKVSRVVKNGENTIYNVEYWTTRKIIATLIDEGNQFEKIDDFIEVLRGFCDVIVNSETTDPFVAMDNKCGMVSHFNIALPFKDVFADTRVTSLDGHHPEIMDQFVNTMDPDLCIEATGITKPNPGFVILHLSFRPKDAVWLFDCDNMMFPNMIRCSVDYAHWCNVLAQTKNAFQDNVDFAIAHATLSIVVNMPYGVLKTMFDLGTHIRGLLNAASSGDPDNREFSGFTFDIDAGNPQLNITFIRRQSTAAESIAVPYSLSGVDIFTQPMIIHHQTLTERVNDVLTAHEKSRIIH